MGIMGKEISYAVDLYIFWKNGSIQNTIYSLQLLHSTWRLEMMSVTFPIELSGLFVACFCMKIVSNFNRILDISLLYPSRYIHFKTSVLCHSFCYHVGIIYSYICTNLFRLSFCRLIVSFTLTTLWSLPTDSLLRTGMSRIMSFLSTMTKSILFVVAPSEPAQVHFLWFFFMKMCYIAATSLPTFHPVICMGMSQMYKMYSNYNCWWCTLKLYL